MTVSFFCKSAASNIWKTVTSVSAAGSKRGRGQGVGKKRAIDLNRGQVIGIGRRLLNMPGLNKPLNYIKGPQRVSLDFEPQDNQGVVEKVKQVRKETFAYRKYRDHPLERGWSGRKAHGRKLGQPEDANDTSFPEFNSTVLMLRPTLIMTSLGRTRKMHGLVVTGNGNGLAGFATAFGNNGKAVLRRGQNRSMQSLVAIKRHDDHTVLHSFFSRYYFTTVFVEPRPKGHGIRAHRIIKAICEAFGITDLVAKVEGSTTNQINLTKAFFLGLMNQKSYHEIANEKKLHLVEIREENYFYPTVLASPEGKIYTDEELKATNENLDFTYYINEGKIKEGKRKKENPWTTHEFYYKHLDRLDLTKNREQTKLLLAARYGDKKVKEVFPLFKSKAKQFAE